MITVSFNMSNERSIISVEGHANYGKKGQDTVCAAVSILVFTLYRKLLDLQRKVFIHNFYHSIEKGNCQLDFEVDEEYGSEVSSAVETVFGGFFILEENFPECVCVI